MAFIQTKGTYRLLFQNNLKKSLFLIHNKHFLRLRFHFSTLNLQRNREKIGPFSWKSGSFFVMTGIFLVWYFKNEKKKVEQRRHLNKNISIGKPRIGSDFELIDHNGRNVTNKDFLGKYMMIYFGFTRCPDICPEELDKMASVINNVNSQRNLVTPIFITCDPNRDTPSQIKEYLKEFHTQIIGLTGSYENIKAVCKAYRVYFSTPPDVKPDDDYLVDHSIFFYLMDPDGHFVDVFGRQYNAQQITSKILQYINDWESSRGQIIS